MWDGGLQWGTPGAIHPAAIGGQELELTHRQQWGAAALLELLDTWRSLQPSDAPSLRSVLLDYVALRLDGHSDTASFVSTLAAAWPDLLVEPALLGLLDEPGTPTVALGWACDSPSATDALSATVYLTQTRGPGRSGLPPLPVFIRAEGGPSFAVLVDDSLALHLDSCPTWVLGNATGAGFYRVDYDGPARAALDTYAAGDALTERERFAFDAKP